MDKKEYNEKVCEICGEAAKSLCFSCLNYFCEYVINLSMIKRKMLDIKRKQ